MDDKDAWLSVLGSLAELLGPADLPRLRSWPSQDKIDTVELAPTHQRLAGKP
jgi:hypothetical protein